MSSNPQNLADDGLERIKALDVLTTLPELLTHHLTVRPDDVAYKVYDNASKSWKDLTFKNVYDQVHAWRHAFAARSELVRGDRVAMLLPNCPEAVFFDLSALSNTLVPVPLHAIDTPKSSAFILNDSGAKVLVTNKLLKWKQIREAAETPEIRLVVITDDKDCDDLEAPIPVMTKETFLKLGETSQLPKEAPKATDLAALVYTSGTTGNPKGVMLTHRNVISNIQGVLKNLQPSGHETFLSFLPLSHTFERTTSYYLALGLGYTTAFNRSIANLQADFREIRPTVLMSVPRVYEMIYAKLQDGLAKKSKFVRYLFDWAVEIGWRDFCRRNHLPVEHTGRAWLDGLMRPLVRKVSSTLLDQFGGRLRIAISGGAALSSKVARTFCGLGLPIIQGYGMTEASPIIAGNNRTLNQPNTVGKPFNNVEVRLGEGDEIQIKGPSITRGYWNRPDATADAFTEDGWFRTGDVGGFNELGLLSIKGRIKEIIVTSTGEKVPPADLEAAIETDPLFSQCYVIGENRPYLSLITVVNPDEWASFAKSCGVDPADPASLDNPSVKTSALKRAKTAAGEFPHYALPRAVVLTQEPWTIENGLITPTLKLKRGPLSKKFANVIAQLYATHG